MAIQTMWLSDIRNKGMTYVRAYVVHNSTQYFSISVFPNSSVHVNTHTIMKLLSLCLNCSLVYLVTLVISSENIRFVFITVKYFLNMKQTK